LNNRVFTADKDHSDTNSGIDGDKNRISFFSTGWVIVLCLFLSVSAFIFRGPSALAGLTCADILLLFCLSRRPLYDLLRGGRTFVFQSLLIVALYLLRYGYSGAFSGLMVSWQIFLAFFPGIVLMSSLPQSKIIHALSRVMPIKPAFVLSVSLNFIPLLISEFRSMYEVQVLRGARILPKELICPWNWSDFVQCLLVPVIVRTLAVSKEIAMAAEIRNFGVSDQRSCWPYD
jgi:energy-coupling factor transport system permease protein